MNSSKENPPETALTGEVSRGSKESDSFPKRVNRYSTARAHARDQGGFMLQNYPELEKIAKKIGLCGEWLLFRHYFTVDKYRLMGGYFCKQHLLCALCALRRGAKALKAYLDRFNAIMAANPGLRASMITLTVKNGEDLAERFEHLRAGVQRLNQRRKDAKRARGFRSEWAKIYGLVGTYEVKTGKNSGLWHPHTHMICLHKEEISKEALADEWFEITGDSHQVDVQQLRHPEDPAQDFVEVFKYAIKFSTMESENVVHAWKILKRKRLMFSAGLFRGVQVPEELTDEPIDGLPYVELLYKYLPGAGYSLSHYSQVDNGAPPIIRQ
jgi:hypothetical protein